MDEDLSLLPEEASADSTTSQKQLGNIALDETKCANLFQEIANSAPHIGMVLPRSGEAQIEAPPNADIEACEDQDETMKNETIVYPSNDLTFKKMELRDDVSFDSYNRKTSTKRCRITDNDVASLQSRITSQAKKVVEHAGVPHARSISLLSNGSTGTAAIHIPKTGSKHDDSAVQALEIMTGQQEEPFWDNLSHSTLADDDGIGKLPISNTRSIISTNSRLSLSDLRDNNKVKDYVDKSYRPRLVRLVGYSPEKAASLDVKKRDWAIGVSRAVSGERKLEQRESNESFRPLPELREDISRTFLET